MREGKPSSTAAIVAAARAAVTDVPTIRGFADPYAEALLPPGYALEGGRTLRGRGAAILRRFTLRYAHIIGLRSIAIDEGIRAAPALAQLVILGAGLDARAWRMPELESVPVFEVDHPFTQQYKRERCADFPRRAHHHFVSVDFATESLDERLQASGHDAEVPTVWVWEGVTMYLEHAAIEATLGTVAARSAPQSRLLVTYLPPALLRTAIGIVTGVLGERFHAAFQPAEMAALLERHGFEVERDESAEQWHANWALPTVTLGRGFSGTERLVTATA